MQRALPCKSHPTVVARQARAHTGSKHRALGPNYSFKGNHNRTDYGPLNSGVRPCCALRFWCLFCASFAKHRNRLLSFRRGPLQIANAPIPRWQRTFRPPPVRALRIVHACSASFARAAQSALVSGKISRGGFARLKSSVVHCTAAVLVQLGLTSQSRGTRIVPILVPLSPALGAKIQP